MVSEQDSGSNGRFVWALAEVIVCTLGQDMLLSRQVSANLTLGWGEGNPVIDSHPIKEGVEMLLAPN